jgi:hypothetical protein
MRFPEETREGSEAHADALRRLDEARAYEHNAGEAHRASKETPREAAAASELVGAQEQVAAREAWSSWVERGY